MSPLPLPFSIGLLTILLHLPILWHVSLQLVDLMKTQFEIVWNVRMLNKTCLFWMCFSLCAFCGLFYFFFLSILNFPQLKLSKTHLILFKDEHLPICHLTNCKNYKWLKEICSCWQTMLLARHWTLSWFHEIHETWLASKASCSSLAGEVMTRPFRN